MAGRKPKPTAVKKLEGNPGKRKLTKKEPVPAKGIHVVFSYHDNWDKLIAAVYNIHEDMKSQMAG